MRGGVGAPTPPPVHVFTRPQALRTDRLPPGFSCGSVRVTTGQGNGHRRLTPSSPSPLLAVQGGTVLQPSNRRSVLLAARCHPSRGRLVNTTKDTQNQQEILGCLQSWGQELGRPSISSGRWPVPAPCPDHTGGHSPALGPGPHSRPRLSGGRREQRLRGWAAYEDEARRGALAPRGSRTFQEGKRFQGRNDFFRDVFKIYLFFPYAFC